jgi:hypothetical protein
MHGKTDTSQDAAVDQLNNQSYRAAQQGQAFSGSGASGGMTAPGTGSAPGDSVGTDGK